MPSLEGFPYLGNIISFPLFREDEKLYSLPLDYEDLYWDAFIP